MEVGWREVRVDTKLSELKRHGEDSKIIAVEWTRLQIRRNQVKGKH